MPWSGTSGIATAARALGGRHRVVSQSLSSIRRANPGQFERCFHTSAADLATGTLRRSTRISNASLRSYSSSSVPEIKPVDLAFDMVGPPEITAEGQCLVICHGLFGSKQNWRSLAKAMSKRLGMTVYTLDLRNHGHSPHAEPHTYAAMALDISNFLQKHCLTSGVNLMGHSMGGKAVMALALNKELNSPLRSLISVDMSPARGKISQEFASYTDAMKEVENARVKTKAEADKILQKVEPLLATRQFLLTNAKTSHDSTLTFRIPLDLLARNIPSIGDFPYTPETAQWPGPTLFIKGGHSRYLNHHNIPIAKAMFPNMRLETLDAGHWVHAERPKETVELVDEFVKGVGK
ncbi:Alpha/Beta hydrolase protein [Naematelia encephala]|uniref:Alpha/Beta hydrolase protein n=1 Tax=Naematelia encephala TaxID=71784 RepID=A0A1Y2ATI6_9TREE|nr:Alpha/Beta hydrolase protein [Naematelia encephala]